MVCGTAFGSLIATQSRMSNPQTEESDIPFVSNDLTGRPGTMGNALDTADAPGKADSELGEEPSVLETDISRASA
jgi:hypothetical protein